jgi:hypothetical protein
MAILKCPDLDAVITASPGAIVRPISPLPTLVLSKGSQLLIDQVVACLMSLVNSVALRDGPTTLVPWSFLDCYSELLRVASLLVATVLCPQQMSLLGAWVILLHPSCSDPDGANVAPTARYALPRLGGDELRPMPCPLQHV